MVVSVTQVTSHIFLRFGKFDGNVACLGGGGNFRVDDGVVPQGHLLSINHVIDVGYGRNGGYEGKVNLTERFYIFSIVGNDHLGIYGHLGRSGLAGGCLVRDKDRLGTNGNYHIVVSVIVAGVRLFLGSAVTTGNNQDGGKGQKQGFEQNFHFFQNYGFVNE